MSPIGEYPTLLDLMRIVSREHDVPVEQIRSRDRTRMVVDARNEFFYLARKFTRKSLGQIGMFCDRHHSTVISGARRHGVPCRYGKQCRS